MIVESGFVSALIQRQEHTYTDECSVFWFNIFAGAVMATALALLSPLIATFYEQPILVDLTRLMALNLLLSAFLTVPSALLSKRLDFKTQLKVSVSAVCVSGVLAIILALRGWGVWAIALQALSSTVVSILVMWRLISWRPARKLSFESLKNLFNFGGFLLLSGLMDNISTRLYTIIIGKSYGTLDLGHFYRATTTKDLPQSMLADIFSRIAFPVFSALASNPVELREGLRVSLVSSMAINLPVMLGLMITAGELVPVLFGPRWNGAIPILQVLCGVGALWPLHVANINALMAQGHSGLIFRLEIIKKSLFIPTIILASQVSVIAIPWGMLALSLLGIFINTWYTRKFLKFGALRQFSVLGPYILITALMVLGVLVFGRLVAAESQWVVLLVKVSVGMLIYIVFCWAFKLEIVELGSSFLKNQRLEAGRS